MEDKKDRRKSEDRRQSPNQRAEKFIKYFLPEEEEKRSGGDRRKPDPDRG
jgi:hypothetical protein